MPTPGKEKGSKRGSASGKNKAAKSLLSLSDIHQERADREGISRQAAKVLNHGDMYSGIYPLAKDNSTAPVETLTPKSADTLQSNNQGAKRNMSSVIEYSQDIANQEAPPPLPVDTYPGECIGAEIKTSPTTGNEYLGLTFRIMPENYPADFETGNPDGEVLSYNRLSTADTPQARYRMRKTMEAMGGPTGRSIDPNELLGLTANLKVTHNEYEGEKRAQIAGIVAA